MQAANTGGDIERLDGSAARRVNELESGRRVNDDAGSRRRDASRIRGCETSVGYLHQHRGDKVRGGNGWDRIRGRGGLSGPRQPDVVFTEEAGQRARAQHFGRAKRENSVVVGQGGSAG